MFRRKDEGADPIDDTENDSMSYQTTPAAAPQSGSAASTPAPAPAMAPSAPLTASVPNTPNPAFRPVAPQAAMAAASRATAAPAPAPAPVAPSANSATATPAPERVAAAPVSRPAAKRVLTVGPDIQMKGEVTSCDRVIIEGTVDATMRDVHTVELAETGSLKGTAEVEDAEISGSFEGDLTVRGRLTVHASGRLRGNITYGEIEIQRGGQISGNIRNAADAKAQGNQGQNQQKKAA